MRLRIFPYGERFKLEVGDSKLRDLDVSPEDLRQHNKELREAVGKISRKWRHKPSLDECEFRLAIEELAFVGNSFLTMIFDGETIALIKRHLESTQSLHVVSEGFFLPWEMLYYDYADVPNDPRNFWGYRYAISRTIPKSLSDCPLSPQIDILGNLRLGLLADPSLPHVVTSEIPSLQAFQHHQTLKITLVAFPVLERTEGTQLSCAKLKQWFSTNDFQVVHFAGHAVPNGDGEPADKSYLILADHFPVTLEQLRVYEVNLHKDPLIVLNACDTGIRDPVQTSSFVGSFLSRGARGVIATECEVSDAFAASFTEHFYTCFFEGQQIGRVLLAVRRHFIDEHRNPLCLLYSLYADPETKLVWFQL